MMCPNCQSEQPMVPGNAVVHTTGVGFMTAGWSYQHCWFRPAGCREKDDEIIVHNPTGLFAFMPSKKQAAPPAHRCRGCGAVVILPPRMPGEERREAREIARTNA